MKITEESKIKDIIPEGYELDNIVLPSVTAGTIYIKKKEKTPEQLAGELGYKIGDKIWNKEYKTYLGQIQYFYWNDNMGDKLLSCRTEKRYYTLELLTNKVAVHCPTKEDFDFIKPYVRPDITELQYRSQLNENICIIINDYDFDDKNDLLKDGYLILTIDDYCKAMDIKPLFVTEDKVNIYNGMTYYYISFNNSIIPNKAIPNGSGSMYETWSTEQATKQYLDSITFPKYIVVTNIGSNDTFNKEFKRKIHDNNKINIEVLKAIKEVPSALKRITTSYVCEEGHVIYKEYTKEVTKKDYEKYLDSLNPILFYTEDFKNGSFPVKSCSNCLFRATDVCPKCDMYNYWQGELKDIPDMKQVDIPNNIFLHGEPIRKGDKCWFVYTNKRTDNINISYCDAENALNHSPDLIGKYFSNETNARNYYNKLVEESKPKFEVGKWYVYTYGDVALYSNNDYHSGFNKEGKWINDYYPITTKYWKLANIDKVKELLCNEAKRRYPINTKYIGLDDQKIHTIQESLKLYEKTYGIFITDGYGSQVYDNGKWAEIIEEQPKPRLVTEDKVNIYQNDNFWVYNPQLNKIDKLIMLDRFRVIKNNKYFSTKEAAEKYKKDIADSLLKYIYEIELKQLKLKYNII